MSTRVYVVPFDYSTQTFRLSPMKGTWNDDKFYLEFPHLELYTLETPEACAVRLIEEILGYKGYRRCLSKLCTISYDYCSRLYEVYLLLSLQGFRSKGEILRPVLHTTNFRGVEYSRSHITEFLARVALDFMNQRNVE